MHNYFEIISGEYCRRIKVKRLRKEINHLMNIGKKCTEKQSGGNIQLNMSFGLLQGIIIIQRG